MCDAPDRGRLLPAHHRISRLRPGGEGPRVCFDAAHNNFHALDGTYAPFGLVLRADGFQLRTLGESLTPAALEPCRVLVIADAQPPARRGDPPTFSSAEVTALEGWVR